VFVSKSLIQLCFPKRCLLGKFAVAEIVDVIITWIFKVLVLLIVNDLSYMLYLVQCSVERLLLTETL